MTVLILPLLIAVVGLLIYVLASNPKISEIGRILLFVATLAILMRMAAGVTLIR